jgi:DNA-binding Xre family transcriptional regulator
MTKCLSDKKILFLEKKIMEVTIRLKNLLQEYELDRHGVKQQIADDLHLNRHTVAKIYNQTAPTISLNVLSRLCTWLENQGLPPDELPAVLFSTGRSKLWETIARKKEVIIYLGEGRQTQEPAAAYRWVSRRDAAVATTLVQELSRKGEQGSPTPPLKFRYVPFRYALVNYDPNELPLPEDLLRAQEIFEQMKEDRENVAKILIGSQRVNYLLECYVSDLFGCKSFTSLTDKVCIPFYFVWREGDQKVPSCFGSTTNPFRRKGAAVPGIHYLDDGKWRTCPWKKQREDAGIIITTNEHKSKVVEIAMFGFSGRATEALANVLGDKEPDFWPPSIAIKGKKIGIYICRLEFSSKQHYDNIEDGPILNKSKVIALSAATLKKYLC